MRVFITGCNTTKKHEKEIKNRLLNVNPELEIIFDFEVFYSLLETVQSFDCEKIKTDIIGLKADVVIWFCPEIVPIGIGGKIRKSLLLQNIHFFCTNGCSSFRGMHGNNLLDVEKVLQTATQKE